MGVLFEGGKSRQELQQERLKKTSKMSLSGLKRSIASRMKKTNAYGDIERTKQHRINRAISHPK